MVTLYIPPPGELFIMNLYRIIDYIYNILIRLVFGIAMPLTIGYNMAVSVVIENVYMSCYGNWAVLSAGIVHVYALNVLNDSLTS